MNLLLLGAALLSGGLLVALIHLLIYLLVLVVVYFIIIWILGLLEVPPIAIKITKVIFALIGLILVINFLLALIP